jgi:hypothetical protein
MTPNARELESVKSVSAESGAISAGSITKISLDWFHCRSATFMYISNFQNAIAKLMGA